MADFLKRCYDCKVDRPVEQFSKDRTRKDGLDCICKDCCSIRIKPYIQKWSKTEAFKKRMRIGLAESRARYPEKTKARLLAYRHKEEIAKDSCENCGSSENLHMHHHDYSKPLEVVTICVTCHEAVHHKGLKV
jgi:hypothetical protein